MTNNTISGSFFPGGNALGRVGPRGSIFLLLWLMLVVSGARGWAQTYAFTTLAGNPGNRSTDGTGSGARFYNPRGVAVDAHGNVVVADTGNNTIRTITAEGVETPEQFKLLQAAGS